MPFTYNVSAINDAKTNSYLPAHMGGNPGGVGGTFPPVDIYPSVR